MMNAIRQIVTSDALGNLSFQVPVELRQRPVEVIVLPVDGTDQSLPQFLTGSDAVDNAWKIIRKTRLNENLQRSIQTLRQQASENALTPDQLDELLRDDD